MRRVTAKLTKLTPELRRRHDVLVNGENAFQQRARLLQALWREARDLPVGVHKGAPLGSTIDLVYARDTLANFLNDAIRAVVRHDVLGPGRDPFSLIEPDRFLCNLLSSQPLCFNLFGELARDLDLATRVMKTMMPGRIQRVTEVSFEHSPGRRDPRFTGDRSAFDVFVRYESPMQRRGFLGIEVKYHEGLKDKAAGHRPRYDELADAMGCFPADRSALKKSPLQQIWRDHLLAGAVLAGGLGYDEGAFVFLYPRDNGACVRALAAYREQLTSDGTFGTWTLEDVVAAHRDAGAPAAAALAARYLDWAVVDRAAEFEKILEVGLDGGAVALEGRRRPRGRWEFRIVQDWGTAWELIDEAPTSRRPGLWMSSWKEALAVLDEGPWTKMVPLVVHPEFAERIAEEFFEREGEDPQSHYLDLWGEKLGTHVRADVTRERR